MVDARRMPLEISALQGLFAAVCSAAAHGGRQAEDLARLAGAVEADPALLEGLLRAAACGPDMGFLEPLARQLGVLLDALVFVGGAIASPFLAEAVWRMGQPERGPRREADDSPSCGWCGSPASIARLRRGDGRRILTCGLCGSEWEAVRLACACCGTQERESLGMLRLEEADARWLETCEACKGYIKTVDERKLPEGETVLPVVEENATLRLDLLAEREGYIRRVPYVLAG